MQQLNLHRLLDAAAGGAVIVLRARIGDTLQEGAVVADLHGGDAIDAAVLGALVTGQERTFHQDPLFAFRLLADIGLRALSPAVNDPATAVQVLDTIQGLLMPLATRDLDIAEVADGTGAVKVVLALPSWDDYLRTALDDLIESGSRSPMVLLQARALLTGLLNTAPPQRRFSITWPTELDSCSSSGAAPSTDTDCVTSPISRATSIRAFWSTCNVKAGTVAERKPPFFTAIEYRPGSNPVTA